MGSLSVISDTPLGDAEPSLPDTQASIVDRLGLALSTEEVLSLFDKLKKEQDLAKAIKSNDAEVPVLLWDKAVCQGEPLEEQKKAPSLLSLFPQGLSAATLARDEGFDEVRVW
jgi:hypothetical protein